MPKIRAIHPGFWNDTTLAECSTGARLFFIGLWTFSDDAGVFEYHERLLKSQIFPFDDGVNVGKLLNELTTHNRIKSFIHNGKKYGLIVNFTRYQKPDSRYIRFTIGDYEHVKDLSHAVGTQCSRGVPPTEGVSEGVSVSEGEGSQEAPTPAQENIKFFQDETFRQEIEKYFSDKGISADVVHFEFEKFLRYWTEPTKNGKKQRWQMQETFEVRRRLITWFERSMTLKQNHKPVISAD